MFLHLLVGPRALSPSAPLGTSWSACAAAQRFAGVYPKSVASVNGERRSHFTRGAHISHERCRYAAVGRRERSYA